MESSKMVQGPEAFGEFIVSACKSRRSDEYRELYNYLLEVFTKADHDMTGRCTRSEFDTMIELAAEAPRKFGYAPSTADTYKNEVEKENARTACFKAISTDGKNISFGEWLNFSYAHICRKAKVLDETMTGQPPKDCPGRMLRSKNDFVDFIKKVVVSRETKEYKEFYGFMLSCFTNADTNLVGYITLTEFDEMVELAAEAPRKFGYAPSTADTYRTDADRVRARTAMFEAIDGDKDGMVNFKEWLDFVYVHVQGKARGL